MNLPGAAAGAVAALLVTLDALPGLPRGVHPVAGAQDELRILIASRQSARDCDVCGPGADLRAVLSQSFVTAVPRYVAPTPSRAVTVVGISSRRQA